MSLLIFSLNTGALPWNSPHPTFIWRFTFLSINCLRELVFGFGVFFVTIGQQCWFFPACLVGSLNILQPHLSDFLTTRCPWSIPAKSSTHFAPSDPCWAQSCNKWQCWRQARWHLTKGASGNPHHHFGVLHWVTQPGLTTTWVSGCYVLNPHVLAAVTLLEEKVVQALAYFCPSWLTPAPCSIQSICGIPLCSTWKRSVPGQ